MKKVLNDIKERLENLKDDYPREEYTHGYNTGLDAAIEEVERKLELIKELGL